MAGALGWQNDALTRFLGDGDLPIEQQLGGKPHPADRDRVTELAVRGQLVRWHAGSRAAAVMSLIHSAKLNGYDPYAYMRDVLERWPTQPASRMAELLPHRWQSIVNAHSTTSLRRRPSWATRTVRRRRGRSARAAM